MANLGYTDLTVQIGTGDFEPSESACNHDTVNLTYFRLKPSIFPDIKAADLVVSHAGAGSVMDCLGEGKSVLVVINEELMGNHQIELAEKLAKDGHLHFCNVSDLIQSLQSLDWSNTIPYTPGEPSKLSNYLDKALGFV